MSITRENNIFLRKKRAYENKENISDNENIQQNKKNSIIRAKEILREFGRDITDLVNLTDIQNQNKKSFINSNNKNNIKPYTNLAQHILHFQKKKDNHNINTNKQLIYDFLNISKKNNYKEN